MRTNRFALRIAVIWLALGSAAVGAEPDMHDHIKAAVNRKEVRKTEMGGWGFMETEYRDAPRDGSILVGFDVALRVHDDSAQILALRPRYLTAKGEIIVGQSAGSFSNSRDHQINRNEKVLAKPGYAVACVFLNHGIGLHGMTVKFMRVAGAALDPKDSYQSPWIGKKGGTNHDKVLSSERGPVVGVYGNVKGPTILAHRLADGQAVGGRGNRGASRAGCDSQAAVGRSARVGHIRCLAAA